MTLGPEKQPRREGLLLLLGYLLVVFALAVWGGVEFGIFERLVTFLK